MEAGSLLQTGTTSLQNGIQRANDAAQTIASATADDTAASGSNAGSGAIETLAEAQVELISAENQVQAASQLIRTGDELLGTVIDTLA